MQLESLIIEKVKDFLFMLFVEEDLGNILHNVCKI